MLNTILLWLKNISNTVISNSQWIYTNSYLDGNALSIITKQWMFRLLTSEVAFRGAGILFISNSPCWRVFSWSLWECIFIWVRCYLSNITISSFLPPTPSHSLPVFLFIFRSIHCSCHHSLFSFNDQSSSSFFFVLFLTSFFFYYSSWHLISHNVYPGHSCGLLQIHNSMRPSFLPVHYYSLCTLFVSECWRRLCIYLWPVCIQILS